MNKQVRIQFPLPRTETNNRGFLWESETSF